MRVFWSSVVISATAAAFLDTATVFSNSGRASGGSNLQEISVAETD